jgi:GTP cyclohydrolase IV
MHAVRPLKQLHQIFLGLGANLGHAQDNILQAIQYIQTRSMVSNVSSFYESPAVGDPSQPRYVNAVCELESDLTLDELSRFVKGIESRMGRGQLEKNAPRPINIDILLYDGVVSNGDGVPIPYPGLDKSPFYLKPLVEIAASKIHPVLNKPLQVLLDRSDHSGVAKVDRSLKIRLDNDIQASQPAVHVSLSRVGVTRLKRNIRINQGGQEALFSARIDLFADLDATQCGVHMSRFSDVLETMTEEISIEPSPNIEFLAARLAQQVVRTQGAVCSEVHIRAQSPMVKRTPVSGKRVEEMYTLIGIAASSSERTRYIVGVEKQGMTVCPCAQEMVKNHSIRLLRDEGYSEREAENIVDLLPVVSHNQRGRGTLLIGADERVRAEHLVHIVEASMSSETYELLKRPDEFFVVNKAHRNPRFVEDVVREMLKNVVEIYPDLPETAFVMVKQENFEGIHQHNAFAERYGTFGEIRSEIYGTGSGVHQTTMEDWLRK